MRGDLDWDFMRGDLGYECARHRVRVPSHKQLDCRAMGMRRERTVAPCAAYTHLATARLHGRCHTGEVGIRKENMVSSRPPFAHLAVAWSVSAQQPAHGQACGD